MAKNFRVRIISDPLGQGHLLFTGTFGWNISTSTTAAATTIPLLIPNKIPRVINFIFKDKRCGFEAKYKNLVFCFVWQLINPC